MLRNLTLVLTATGTHWRPSSNGSNSQIHNLLEYHPGFSIKNGLEVPRVGVEGNFIYIPGKCLRTYFHNSKHLLWPVVLLSIMLLLNNRISLHAWLLAFHKPFPSTHHHSVIWESIKPPRRMRRLRLNMLTILPKGLHTNRSSTKTKTKTPTPCPMLLYFSESCVLSKKWTFKQVNVFSSDSFKLSIYYFSIFQAQKQMLRHYWVYLVIRVNHHYLHHVPLEHSWTTWVNLHPTFIGHGKKNSLELLLPLQFKECWQLSAYKLDSLRKKLVSEPSALSFPQQAPAALCSA